MSKSYNNTIDLSDDADQVKKKVSTMITDAKRIKLSDKGHPDVCSVFSYYETFVPDKKEEVRDWCINAKLGCTDCKKELAQEIMKVLAPIHEKRKDLLKDENKLRKILDIGKDRARDIAVKTRAEIKDLIKI